MNYNLHLKMEQAAHWSRVYAAAFAHHGDPVRATTSADEAAEIFREKFPEYDHDIEE